MGTATRVVGGHDPPQDPLRFTPDYAPEAEHISCLVPRIWAKLLFYQSPEPQDLCAPDGQGSMQGIHHGTRKASYAFPLFEGALDPILRQPNCNRILSLSCFPSFSTFNSVERSFVLNHSTSHGTPPFAEGTFVTSATDGATVTNQIHSKPPKHTSLPLSNIWACLFLMVSLQGN